jgi:tRNA threonylcarbamoyladenosine biosynthesis protein TsaB
MVVSVMLILAMDCSSAACSVAVSRDSTIIGRDFSLMTRGHAPALPPMISRVLADCGLGARDMDAFAVSVGPGSFTGLRVAMAAAKGLAVAADRPLIGVSCFDAVARRASSENVDGTYEALLLTLASKREEVFVQARDAAGHELIADQVLRPTEIDRLVGDKLSDGARLLVAGDATEVVTEVLRAPDSHCLALVFEGSMMPPDAEDIALLAHDISTRDGIISNTYTAGLVPVYLRPPAAKKAS